MENNTQFAGFFRITTKKILPHSHLKRMLSWSFLLGMVYYSSAEIFQHGIFYGYTPVVVTIISLQSVGGLVVAATIKYADNILKGKAAINHIFLLVGTPVWVLRWDCISRFGVWMLVCQS